MDQADTPVEEPPVAALPADAQRRARQRRRAIWLAGTLAVLAVVTCIVWLVDVVTTERTLHAVTSAALPPPPLAAGAPPATTAPATAVAPTAAAAGAALAAAALPVSVPSQPMPAQPARAPAAQAAVAAAVEPAPVRDGAKPHKAAKRPAVRRVAKRMTDSATFRRCPPLGQAGAVMCRWHICNGGAGKEAACRPYLERRP